MKSDPSYVGVTETAMPGFSGPLRRALEAHAARRLGEAEFYCRLVLAADKKQFDALHLLGVIEYQRGHFGEAERLIRQALKINPRSVQAHSNFAMVLQQLGRDTEALASLDKALVIDSNHLLALNNRGHILWRLKRLDEALQSLDRALAIKPDYIEALCNRGNVLADLQNFQEALISYDRALAIDSQDVPTLNNRANVLWAMDRRDEALHSYGEAAMLDPDDLSVLKDRGSALLQSDQVDEALVCFDHALIVKPGDIYFLYRRGEALAKLDRHEDSLASFDQALAGQPDYVDALDNRGNVLAKLQRAAEAIASFDQALAVKPETAEAHWNRGLTLLRTGDYEQGWKEYEWRWKMPGPQWQPRGFDQPLWLGEEPIEGKTILLHAEQGFGDSIQFLRYVPMVAALGAKVVVEVQPALQSLASSIKAASLVIARGDALPPFDCHCPLLSLALALKTRTETIPRNTPYLFVAPRRVSAWRDRLPKHDKLRIALAWSGNPDFPDDRTRSVGLLPLASLLSMPQFQFVSIQKELRVGDEEILQKAPQVLHVGDKLADFSDTAAIMSLVDLVISSDTSVAHLAGALHRPVWILLEHAADWRWLTDREDSPWYPSARLFRQRTAKDWDEVVRRIVEALQSL